MRNFKTFALLGLLAAVLSVSASAQLVSLTSTTISAAMTASANSVCLTSPTGVVVPGIGTLGSSLYIGGTELMRVQSVTTASSSCFNVSRTDRRVGHAILEAVYIGRVNDFKAMDQAGTCTTAAMDVRPWVNTRNNNIWDCLSSKWTVISGPAQYGVGLTAMGPAATGTDIGSALLPWRNLYLGTAATNNFVITPGATAAARVISIVDPLGAATLAYTNPNAALVQNFTNTSATSLNVVTDIRATTAGAETIGTAAKPFGVLYLGTAATNNLVITPAATGGARVVTAGDPGGADSLAYLAATQTLTGKTLTGAVITDTAKATAQFDAVIGTTGATLTNVVGMVLTVVPGTYRFYVNASGTSTGNGGTKYAFKYGGGAVITSIESTARAFTASAVAVTHQTSNADQAVLEGATAANISAVIEGTMVVGTGGTIQFQAAQNTAHVDTTSVYVGSSMTFTRIL